MKKKIALIYGGEGKEKGVSKRSAETLFSLIDREKYEVLPIFISENGGWFIAERDPFGSMPTLSARPTYPIRLNGRCGLLSGKEMIEIDLAIPVLHGDRGEDGTVQGALDSAHVKYIGSGTVASAVCIDKYVTKLAATALGIPCAKGILFDGEPAERALYIAEEKIGYPMFIKPTSLGSSIGAKRVDTKEDFYKAYARAKCYGRVLAEELLPIKYEIECAYFSDGEREVFNPAGIIETGGETYDFDRKYRTKNTARVLDAPPEGAEEMTEAAKRLCHAIGVRHIGRVDFIVTKDGKIYFNEINTIPGMTKTSLYPELIKRAIGRDFIGALLEAML